MCSGIQGSRSAVCPQEERGTMGREIIDYITQFETTQVSPIWGGAQVFHFLCLGHLNMARALGFELENVSEHLTIVREGQMQTEEELDALIHRNEFDYTSFEQETEHLRQMKAEHKEGLCGGGCFGPLTVVSGILGAENMLRLLAGNPKLVERFTAYAAGFMEELARRETEEGGQFFWIAEPLASLLSPKNSWRFSGQYIQKIYQAAEVPGLLHVCGRTLKHTPYLVRTGAQLLSIDSCTDIGECIRMVDEDVVIMGNVNPSTLRFGTKEEVEEEVGEVLGKCRGFRNFVLSTGCSVMEGTPDENMQVMFDMAGEEN